MLIVRSTIPLGNRGCGLEARTKITHYIDHQEVCKLDVEVSEFSCPLMQPGSTCYLGSSSLIASSIEFSVPADIDMPVEDIIREARAAIRGKIDPGYCPASKK